MSIKKTVVSHVESSVNREERLKVASIGVHIPEIVCPFIGDFEGSHWTCGGPRADTLADQTSSTAAANFFSFAAGNSYSSGLRDQTPVPPGYPSDIGAGVGSALSCLD